MQYAELYANIGDLELLVNSAVESVFQSMVLAKLVIIRYSTTLRKLIVAIHEDYAIENFDSLEERQIYLKYNNMAKFFYKITIPTISAGSLMYYVVPLEHFLRTMHRNDTNPFVLPFGTRLFFEINDSRTYLMVYAYQSPMIYVLVCHSAWFCLLTTMVFHICGQLAIVEYRIRTIRVPLLNETDDSNAVFRRIAQKHLRAIWMAKSMDDAFNLVLLQDLAGSTLLLGLTSYLVIVRTQTSFLVFCLSMVCSVTMLCLLYAYCIVGECLIEESTKIHEAYYQCNWYESSMNFRKCLIISMGATQEALHLSAGKTYIFCLNGFTDVLRSAMGYLSLLRNFATTIQGFKIMHSSYANHVSIKYSLRTDLKSVRELYGWNKRVLSIGGMWPLEKSFMKFYISYLYLASHFVMAVCDFVSVFGDITLMIANLSETSVQAMVGVKMLVLRYSSPLTNIVKQIEARSKQDSFRDEKEKCLYLEYIMIGRSFFLTGSYVAIAAVIIYHLKPFEDIIKAVLQNETIPFILPYRMRLFFSIPNTRTYVLLYLSQSPMLYYYYCHTASVCFLCTLIVHVCGEMSILAYRIRNIDASESSKDYSKPEIAFRDATIKHQKIIRTAEAIDEVFNVVLLEELITSTMLIGLAAYSVLSKSLMVSMSEFFFFVNYTLALFLLLLVYCITGEFLISESKNVQNAFYECRWYTFSSKYQKHMLMGMARAQTPLRLTAGQFYVFSLDRYSSILKTAGAYVSMLRTVV
ncbi:odorant receptor 13a-like [Venturia canescens]|uniref:odorant receptor 13a-like n=1 Tax=Venturia canescens TaxID=32260 RepID=UPI001C9C9A03|nr:odorant receptor 13a-like [Venturia canescens]